MATAPVMQKEIEVILTRQWASYLAMPIFVVDPEGNTVYYNESAEGLFGLRFDEVGGISAEQWMSTFQLIDDSGTLLDGETAPVSIALLHRRPAHRSFWLARRDAAPRRVELTAFPLIGQSDRFLGAVGIFWETQ